MAGRRVSETLIPNLHLWKNVQYHNLGIERFVVNFINIFRMHFWYESLFKAKK